VQEYTFELGEGLVCSLQTLVDSRLLMQANSGGGKSWALRRLLEQTHGQVQHLVLDPEGEFATLRERHDYLHVAQEGGDLVADPSTARALGDRLLRHGVSAVLDLHELAPAERVHFAKRFLEALVEARRELWHPVLVVVDEAHLFCPQRGHSESSAAVIALATRGRKRGYCCVLATQRLSKLHKDAAAECNNKLIGRTVIDVDVGRAGDELGLGRGESVLRGLPPGDFFAVGPAFGAPAARRVTIGPVATTHPKAGARLIFSPPPAAVRAILPLLQGLLADDVAETEPPDERCALERQVAELRLRLAEAEARPTLRHGALDRLRALAGDLAELARSLETLLVPPDGWEDDEQGETAVRRLTPDEIATRGDALIEQLRATPGEPPAPALTRPQRDILDALAWLERFQPSTERTLLALMADASPRSSAYLNNLGALRTAGLVQYPEPKHIALTPSGREHANPTSNMPRNSQQLQAQLCVKLPAPQARILQALIATYPAPIDRTKLADRAEASATSSAFANNLGALRSLGVVDYPKKGQVVALPCLFLPGGRS